MQLSFAKLALPKTGTLVCLVRQKRLEGEAKALDEAMGGALGRAIKAAGFKGETGERLSLMAPGDTKLDRIMLIDTGKIDAADMPAWARFGAQITAALIEVRAKSATMLTDSVPAEAAILALAEGAGLRAYRFDRYLSEAKKDKLFRPDKLTLAAEGHKALKSAFAVREAVLSGVRLTQDLTSEPANILTPAAFADRVEALGELGLKVEILDQKALEKKGFRALLGVAQGSANPPRVAVISWAGKSGKDKLKDPLAFIGKGVTFDSGGISIKPAQGMEQMKWDMGGAGIVTGLMAALAARKAEVDAVGLLGLVENMPSGSAQRPGDVVQTLDGQTVEVINTDAEGRLVLADVMAYARAVFKPKLMIDLATLTGAIIVALGHEYAGLFSTDDALAAQLTKAGEATGDKVWRLPLADAYDKLIDSAVADMKNVGDRSAGSITAAQFLKRFAGDTAWAHIDVAGMVWADQPGAFYDKGATGFGVRLLDRFVADSYE
ncbi:MAG: leucyl aminopeptidase [Rhodothalassiaceae bacterium]